MLYKFTDKVVLAFTGAGKQYRVNALLIRTQAFNKHLDLQDYEYFVFNIPPQVTDGASIPRILWSIINPTDWRILYPSQPHDYMYEKKDKILKGVVYDKVADIYSPSSIEVRYTRKDADLILREKMISFGGGWLLRNLVYIAVRIGGILSFNK